MNPQNVRLIWDRFSPIIYRPPLQRNASRFVVSQELYGLTALLRDPV